jgi:hypothetical protein
MDQIEEFTDRRQKAWCIHCGATLAGVTTSRDHVPSKSLLRKPYPANLPVVEICAGCNGGFSQDEEYTAALLGSVVSGSADPGDQSNLAAGILARSPNLRARIERCGRDYETAGGESRRVWKPEAERISRVIVKNARGHAFFEYGEPMLERPLHVGFVPLMCMDADEHIEFETVESGSLWPEVGSRMMTRMLTGQNLSDGWVVVQDGIYRYAVIQQDGLLVRSVIFEYLATEVYWGEP